MDGERKPGKQALKDATRRVASAGSRAVTYRIKSARLDVPRDADGLPLAREHRIAEAMREAHERASATRLDEASPAGRGVAAWLADYRASRRVRDAEATAAEVVEWVDGLLAATASRTIPTTVAQLSQVPASSQRLGLAVSGDPDAPRDGVLIQPTTTPSDPAAKPWEVGGRQAALNLAPWGKLLANVLAGRVRGEPDAAYRLQAKRQAGMVAGPPVVDRGHDDRLLAAYAIATGPGPVVPVTYLAADGEVRVRAARMTGARLSNVTPTARRMPRMVEPVNQLRPSRPHRTQRHDAIPAPAYLPGPAELALRPPTDADAPKWFATRHYRATKDSWRSRLKIRHRRSP